MKFTVNYTFNDIYEMQKMHYSSSKLKWFILAMGILLIFSGILPILYYEIDLLSIVVVILSVLLFLYPLTFLRLISYWLFKNARNVKDEITYEINNQGIKVANRLESGVIKWEDFYKYLYSSDYLLLYRTHRLLTLIPKRSLEEKNWTGLIDLVKLKIK